MAMTGDRDDAKNQPEADGAQDVEIIVPPNPISKKVTRGGIGAVDANTLARAEKVMQDLGNDYLSWVEKDLGRLIIAFEELQAADNPKPVLEKLFQIAHDIKGQGGSFGFDLMTKLGNHLCRLIESIDQVGPQEQTAIQLHIDAMKNVVHQRIKGGGKDEDEAVVAGLEQLVAKLVIK